MSVLLEACIDSVADGLAAERAGAGRVELCANLLEGGTTPSIGLVRMVTAHLEIPVFAIIRPRGGDCCYSAEDIEVMLKDIEAAKAAGVHGIVSGALHPNGVVDEDGTEALLEAAAPLPFTFHRAFDQVRDHDEALDTCMALGVSRILTSGGMPTALDAADTLQRLRQRAGSRLVIMAGGGIRASNIRAVIERTGVREVHLGPRRVQPSTMRVKAGTARISKSGRDEWDSECLDGDALAAAVQAAHAS